MNKSSILLEAFVLLIVFPIEASAYYPGDIVGIYTVSPCQYLTVEINSYGLKFIDCNEVSLNTWHCDCVNNSFDLKAEILPDAPSIDYRISIEIFNPKEEKKEVKKVVPFSAGVVFYAQKTPAPTPLPSPSPMPTPTTTPEKEQDKTEKIEVGVGCDCNVLQDGIRTFKNQLHDALQKLNDCDQERTVLREDISACLDAYSQYAMLKKENEKCIRKKTFYQITCIPLAILLLLCLYALFSRAEEENNSSKKESKNATSTSIEVANNES
ncbi:MAG: hypothetical protein ACTSYD_02185 [Candidatus Heimdallarchaeaceae archaeon]